ncbi:MAG: SusC/RagA family TonB-linked outer membrane protein [Paludibacteraceae bacterium]
MKRFLSNMHLFRFAALVCMMLIGVSLFAQTTATGVVLDAANNEPIIGANIIEVGTTNGTITDFDGNFTLNVKTGAKLEISYMGYKSVSLPAAANMRVMLGEDSELLDEVIVVGYGVVKKNDATGSVTAIKPDDMNKGLNTNAQEMMQGKIAGVVVTSDGGTPGAGATIRIRGGSSLSASNSPLVVIDGLAMDNNGIPGASNPLSMVNPNDIETFTVLKDASATAIYGSRASNGVIIITTKKGKAGSKPKFSYEGNVSISNLTNRTEVFTGDQMRAYATAIGLPANTISCLGNASTDWQDQIYRTAVSTDHSFSVVGGTKHMPYRASVGYTLNNGTIKTSQMQRVTASVNLSPSFFDKHLNINFNAKGLYIRNSYAASVVGAAIAMDPTAPIYGGMRNVFGDEIISDQVINDFFGGYYQPTVTANYNDDTWQYANDEQSTVNPVASLNQQSSIANSGSFVGNLEADYQIHGFEDLRLHANFGADYSYGKQKYESSPFGTADHYYGWKGFDEKNKYNLQFNCYIQYYKDFTESQHFDIMAGYEWQHFYNDYISEGNGVIRETNNDPTKRGVKYPVSTSSFKTESYLVSFFGRLNYIGWNQLMLTATVRGDGSSRFAPDRRWGVFPSVALGWKIKETFLKDNNVVSDLKLRLGYGITGQQEINQGDYPYMAQYTIAQDHAYYPIGGEDCQLVDDFGDVVKDSEGNVLYTSFRPNAYNSELTWEKTTTYNAGIDYGFLNGRVTGAIDYYFRQTDDLLNTIPVAVGTNFRNKVISNVGTLTNQGVEFSINAVAVDRKNFKWDLGFNVTYNENKITKLNTGEDQTPIPTGGISCGTGNTIQRHDVGYAASSFYVYETAVGTRDNGEKFYYVVDRSGDGKISEEDQYYYHSPNAPVTMGFQTKFQFFGFDLGISLRSNIGNYVYNDVLAANLQYCQSENLYRNGYHNIMLTAFDTYYNKGMKSDGVYKSAEGTEKFSEWYRLDYFVENGSFLRIDNITLGYSFQKPKISGRVYLTVQNPCIISKYSGLDPEVFGGIDNNIYPRSMTSLVGLSLQF